MRVFVFLLILANLLFLAWTQGYFGATSNPDAFRVQQQLQPERIVVVARGEAPPEPSKAEVPAKPPETLAGTAPKVIGASINTCLLLSELPPADAEKLENVLAERFFALQLLRTSNAASGSYWVNIAPLGSKQEADSKAAELKKLGVPEFFVVNEAGPNNRAISLGLFSSRDAALARLEMLRGKSVKSARITERNVKPASVSLELQGPVEQMDKLRQVILDTLPEIAPAECKGAAASTQ